MTRWLAALIAAGVITLVVPPRTRAWAFSRGWFERSADTARRRGARRPTTGGVVAAAAVAVAAVAAGPTEAVARGPLAAVAVAVAGAFVLGIDKRAGWRAVAGTRVAAALAVALVGPRAELTGTAAVDVAITTLGVVTVIGGLARLEQAEAAAPLAVSIPAVALVIAAARVGDDATAAVAAGAAGAAVGLLAGTLPPADLRLGRTGPTVLGATLASAAIAHDPRLGAGASLAVPALLLAVPLAVALVRGATARLAVRRVPALAAVGIAALAGSAAATLADRGDLDPLPALAAGLAVPVLLALVALTARRPAGAPRIPWWAFAGGGAVLVGLGAMAAVAGRTLLDARASMEAGRDAAQTGLEAATDGDLDAAQAAFATADAAFAEAQDDLGSPVVSPGLAVPGVAQNLRAARELAAVGRELTGTAVAVATRAGASDLVIADGTVPLDAVGAVGEQLTDAVSTLDRAAVRLADVDDRFLAGQLREGIAAVADRITDAGDTIRTAADAARLAPALLGGDGPRTYVVAMLAPSELRGAGGLFGDYAELRAEDGRLAVTRAGGAAELDAASDDALVDEAIPAVYREEYAGFRPGTFLQNLSVTPDVPTFGAAVTAAWPLTGDGARADGVVVIDPLGLAAMLALTGPVTVADWPEPLSAQNVAEVLLFEHYDVLPVDVIDRFQSEVVAAVVDALGRTDLGTPAAIAATLGPAATGGHLRLYSSTAEEQAFFGALGIDGGVPEEDGHDSLVVSLQNGSESKIDWFLRQELTYEVFVDEATGATTAVATLTLRNDAPSEGVAEYVIGGGAGSPTVAGESRLFVGILSPLTVQRVTDGDGTPIGATLGHEQDLGSARVLVDLAPGGSATIRFELAGTLDDAAYALRLVPQVASAPTDATVTINGATQQLVLDGPADLGADVVR